MLNTGKISQVKNNNFYLIQIFPNNQNCTSCNLQNKCNINNRQYLELKGPEGLSKGDIVDIYLPENSRSLFFSILFANPIIVFFILIIILRFFLTSDNLTFLISSIFAVIDFIISLIFLKRKEKRNINKVKIIQKNIRKEYENN